jgi:hypothetical protein
MTVLEHDSLVHDVHHSMLPVALFSVSWFVALAGWWLVEVLA